MTSNTTCQSAKCAEVRKENARLRAMLTERGIEVPTPAGAKQTGTERARARYGARDSDAGWSGTYVNLNN